MYDRFSGQARRVVQLAHAEARRLRHDYVGTGHLLLGALREESGGAAALLGACGADPEKLQNATFSPLPPAEEATDWETLPFTPRARTALAWAQQEASRLRHPWVGPEHLLVGVAREPDSIAGEVLRDLALSFEKLRGELEKRPPPENRDEMLQPPSAGPAALADPSAGALQTLVTADPLPPDVQEETPAAAAAAESGARPPEQPTARLSVVERQLVTLRVCVAAAGGGVVGYGLLGPGGAWLGVLAGAMVGLVRNPHLTTILGCVAGLLAGHIYGAGEATAYVAGGLSGLALGACLGDWRRFGVPPRGG
jgi:hypothetical protein